MRFTLSAALLLAACCALAAVCTDAASASAAAATPIRYTAAAEADRIQSLPGLAEMPSFAMFSGYLLANADTQNYIFYWYAESALSPASDPLVWWSNGGPGCSGLVGFLTESGPLRPLPSGAGLTPMPYAWNTVANTLYIEGPVGVGFSFSASGAYASDDDSTAYDNFGALQSFFAKFPHLQSNAFYLSAESYGGHYVPQLATVIVAARQQNPAVMANFRGFLLGNPLTDPFENLIGECSTVCGHSMADKPSCDAYQFSCLGKNGSYSQACVDACGAVFGEIGNVDQLGVDYPVCNQDEEGRRMTRGIYAKRRLQPNFPAKARARLEQLEPIPYDDCMWNEETTYLNRADVKAALHVNTSVVTWAWQTCSDDEGSPYNYDDAFDTPIEPLYAGLIAAGLRMIIYSGDDDTRAGTPGTRYWMHALWSDSIVDLWSPWLYTSSAYGSQVGGFVTRFKGISLVTVHSAGHMVSDYTPEKGLALLKHFLAGDFNEAQTSDDSEDAAQTLADE